MTIEMTYAQYRGATYRAQCATWKLAAILGVASAHLRCLPAYRSSQGLLERQAVAQAARFERARRRGTAVVGTESTPVWFWAFTGPNGSHGGTVVAIDMRDALVKGLTSDVAGSMFAVVHNVPGDVVDSLPGNHQAKFEITGPWGSLLGVRAQAEASMYAAHDANGLYTLRQARYRSRLLAGSEHPHDVCAVATSAKQLHEMTVKHWPDADFTAISAEMQ